MRQKQPSCFCNRTSEEKLKARLKLAVLILNLARVILLVWLLIAGLKM